jgi:hypothetical protein
MFKTKIYQRKKVSLLNHQSHLEDSDGIHKNLEPERQRLLRLHKKYEFSMNRVEELLENRKINSSSTDPRYLESRYVHL